MEHGGPYRNFKGVKLNKNKGELDFLGIVRNRVWRMSGAPIIIYFSMLCVCLIFVKSVLISIGNQLATTKCNLDIR
jgi:hypothetical protein